MRIALISDVHFGKLSTTKELSVPGESIEDETDGGMPLNAGFEEVLQKQPSEFLFVLGDLTSTGSPVEYSRSIQCIYSTATKAGIAKENVVLAVGNHDTDRRISKIAEEWVEAEKTGYPLSEAKTHYQLIAAGHGETHAEQVFDDKGPVPFSGVIERDDVVIFVLNSGWLCSHESSTKHGKLHLTQLDWCKEVIPRYTEDPRWKIILLHHHPFNYPFTIPGHDTSLLEEGPELVEIAGSCGINIICHGHRHHPKVQNESRDGWRNPITFLCAGSFSVNAKHRKAGTIPNLFHTLELSPASESKVLTVRSYQYSISTGWIPIQINSPETPIDDVMVFERYYSQIEIQNSFLALLPQPAPPVVELPQWTELPLQLRTLRYNKLNSIIEVLAAKDYKIHGLYPNPVALIRREP